MKLTLESKMLEMFYNTIGDLVPTYNTANDMTGTQTIANATILAKFTTFCGPSITCTDPLTTLLVGYVDA